MIWPFKKKSLSQTQTCACPTCDGKGVVPAETDTVALAGVDGVPAHVKLLQDELRTAALSLRATGQHGLLIGLTVTPIPNGTQEKEAIAAGCAVSVSGDGLTDPERFVVGRLLANHVASMLDADR